MFDLIVLYFVISMIVNLVKGGKEQAQKQEQQKQVRRPQKKEKTSSPMVSSKPIQPGAGKTVGNLPKMQSSLSKIDPTLANAGEIKIMIGENPATIVTKTVKTDAISVITSDKNDKNDEKVQQVFVPSEENILAGIVWSEILGPPICKRRR